MIVDSLSLQTECSHCSVILKRETTPTLGNSTFDILLVKNRVQVRNCDRLKAQILVTTASC